VSPSLNLLYFPTRNFFRKLRFLTCKRVKKYSSRDIRLEVRFHTGNFVIETVFERFLILEEGTNFGADDIFLFGDIRTILRDSICVGNTVQF